MRVGNRQNGITLDLSPLSYSWSKRREMKSLPKADISLIVPYWNLLWI